MMEAKLMSEEEWENLVSLALGIIILVGFAYFGL